MFYADSTSSTSYDIWVATRTSTLGVFSAGVSVAGLNGNDLEAGPWLSGDEKLIYFYSVRAGGLGGADIWIADLAANGASNVRNLADVNTASDEENPVLTPDGLTIVFSSRQSGRGAKGNYDIWIARRTTAADGFGQSVNVAELNTTADDAPSWISPDGCTLSFVRNRVSANAFDLYQATRGR